MEPFPDLDASGLRVEAKAVVALVVYRSRGGGDAGVSQRYLQKLLNRTKRGSAKKLLKSLCDNQWIEVSQSHGLITETSYKPGKRFTPDQRDRWTTTGQRLFDPSEGCLVPFLTRPAIKHGFLNISGMLVIGLLQAESPVSDTVLVKALSPLVARTTLAGSTGVFSRLIRSGVLDRPVDGVWFVPDNLEHRLLQYEIESGALERVERLHAQIEDEQRRNREKVLGSTTIQEAKAHMRRQPCYWCGAIPGPSGAEVDHFPPKRIGGFDAVGIMFPVCTRCNNERSAFVKRIPSSCVAKATRVIAEDPNDLRRFSNVVIEFMYLVHEVAFEADDPPLSATGIAIAAPLWLTTHGFVEGAEIVDTTTGEISEIPPADEDKWHLPPRAK